MMTPELAIALLAHPFQIAIAVVALGSALRLAVSALRAARPTRLEAPGALPLRAAA